MSLTLPSGSTALETIREDLEIIDGHRHQGGGTDGAKITHLGLALAGDVSFGEGAATDLKFVHLTNQTDTDVTGSNKLYSQGGELFFLDGSGNRIEFTEAGSLKAPTGSLNKFPLEETQSDQTISAVDTFSYLAVGSTTARQVTLPAASSVDSGRFFVIHDISGSLSSSHITLSPNGSDRINGLSSMEVYGTTMMVRNEDGNGWHAWKQLNSADIFQKPAATFTQDVFVQGNLHCSGNVNLGDTASDVATVQRLEVERNLGVDGQAVFNGSVNVSGSALINTNLTVNGNTVLGDNTSDSTTVRFLYALNSINCSGSLNLAGNLTVNGNSTLGNADSDQTTINGSLTVSEDCFLGGDSSDAVWIAGNCIVSGSTQLGLDASDETQVSTLEVVNTLGVQGNSVFAGDLAVSGSITGVFDGTAKTLSSVSSSLASGARLLDVVTYTNSPNSAQSHTYQADTTFCIVEMWGGGGGGGGVVSNNSSDSGAGGGGGSGAYLKIKFNVPTAVTGTTLIVGGGGAGGDGSTAGDGADGGSSHFWTPAGQRTALGGGGCPITLANSTSFITQGGAGATAPDSTPDVVMRDAGIRGRPGMVLAAAIRTTLGGEGGGHGGGSGGQGNQDGSIGSFGCGGGGAAVETTTTDRDGGNGGVGRIIVWEYAGEPIA